MTASAIGVVLAVGVACGKLLLVAACCGLAACLAGVLNSGSDGDMPGLREPRGE
jgi:hypothetical protein